MSSNKTALTIPALKVQQWIPDWNATTWKPAEGRSEPNHWFYQLSLPAATLLALSDVYKRSAKDRARASEDRGIQRSRQTDRTDEIQRYIAHGYPWSSLNSRQRESGDFKDLRQPGWLPTAIIVNILVKNSERNGSQIDEQDLIKITNGSNGTATFELPEQLATGRRSAQVAPIEIIDGQHRLWAFENIKDDQKKFELPVIAFVGLDLSWRAYLFYMINIKPKKINPSFAFDIYPLLRDQDWLTRIDGHIVYRETRAQELVDLLCYCADSPWHERINMLGESGQRGLMASQATWVRSLLASYVKDGRKSKIGGLFGSAVGENKTVLPWKLTTQAAFLILVGQAVQKAFEKCKEPWARALRTANANASAAAEPGQQALHSDQDAAFFGPFNLINNDQGIRALLQITNDLFFTQADDLKLSNLAADIDKQGNQGDFAAIKNCLAVFKKKQKLGDFLHDVAELLSLYDWRTFAGPELSDDEKQRKAAFRGSGGYKALREDLLQHFADSPQHSSIAQIAKTIQEL